MATEKMDLEDLKDRAKEEISEIKNLFDDGLQINDFKVLLNKGMAGLEKMSYYMKFAEEFKKKSGRIKVSTIVRMVDDWIKLPWYLEGIDGWVIRRLIKVAYNTLKKNGWDLNLQI